MDYTETLNDPTLLLGFKELLNDPDAHVVKRTTRVFTNVYNHSLRLLSEDKISETTLLEAWPYLSDIIDNIFNIFGSAENEGVLLILVKFLECSVDRHLTSDFSKYTEICHRSREYIKRGLRALKDLVSTPYVGGSVFIVAIKALIRIACLRDDLHEPIVNLVKKLLLSPPPTLFDHNVRSLNKILQFNLFRLLKKSNCTTLKKNLIEMMVSTGASRRSLIPWTPKEIVVPKRKIPQQNIDDAILGRISPPNKRSKTNSTNEESKIYKVNNNLSKTNYMLPTELPRSSFQFLSSLIPKASSNKNDEKDIFNSLTLDKVCSLIVSNLHSLPDSMPESFPLDFAEKTIVSEKINVMRSHLSVMFVGLLDSEQQSFSAPIHNISPMPKTSIDTQQQNKQIPVSNDIKKTIAINDVDMRNIVNTCKELRDVDMRVRPNVNCVVKESQPPKIFPRSEKSPEKSSSLQDDQCGRIKKDPRLNNKPAVTKVPSPPTTPNNPSEATSKEDAPVNNTPQASKDPRLQNRPRQQSAAETSSQENVRQDPRIANGNTRPRDATRPAAAAVLNEPEKLPSAMNNMLVNENIGNRFPMNNYQSNNRMMLNPSYQPVNGVFRQQFQHRDQRSRMPRFDIQATAPARSNYSRWQGNNFNNPYSYYPNEGRFQPS